jgi:DNA-binding SARP family transcriptional activator
MEVEARLGRTDAARRTFRQLESRLAELDVDPDQVTMDLADRLLSREWARSARL